MSYFKNIIFDLGGIVLDIDYNRTIDAFRKLGIHDAEKLYSQVSQINLFDDLEKGLISEKEFYSGMRKLSGHDISDEQIEDAWNSLIIRLPEENVDLLFELKRKHRLFLLSNTNLIHERCYRNLITEEYVRFIFDELFEKMYLSHHIQLRKPDPAIFKYVLKDADIDIRESCFLDDSKQHVESATKLGLASFLVKESLTEFFSNRFSEKTGLYSV